MENITETDPTDTELADLAARLDPLPYEVKEESMPRKGLSPTQRTLRALRDQGRVCAIVEKFNSYAGPFGRREDLFGIIDVLALDPERGVVGVQCCGSDFKAHKDKILVERQQETHDWLSTPGTALEIWAWRKVKLQRGGKAERWAPRVETITLDMVEARVD